MTVSLAQLDELLQQVQAPHPFKAYVAATKLEQLRPEMDDAQLAAYEAALLAAAVVREAPAAGSEGSAAMSA
ncbi:hypothetical protein [Chitinibacter tainanensis]|uniref:hypothetical protein n=1 Tax=Chitinibacter tainanensis TaxID=230667 RepID=UPI0003F9D7C0|nr:hypothetical protein [Chitinibacter tainanensis]